MERLERLAALEPLVQVLAQQKRKPLKRLTQLPGQLQLQSNDGAIS